MKNLVIENKGNQMILKINKSLLFKAFRLTSIQTYILAGFG